MSQYAMDEWNNQEETALPFVEDEYDTRLAQLIDETNKGRTVLATILTDIENIVHHVNPAIEAEWQTTIAVWENNLLEAQISMRRAKRKSALVQTCINQGTKVDDTMIEEALDAEFAEWQERLAEATKEYEKAVAARTHSVKIGPAKSQSLKEVFRILAKRLHPDINDSLDEDARMLFFLAQTAYKQADLEMLESLELSTRNREPHTRVPKTIEEAQADLQAVMDQVARLERRKKDLMAEHPYCLLALLRDEAWIESHIGKLKEEIEACRKAELEYRSRMGEAGKLDG